MADSISPHFVDIDFPPVWSLEQKIKIFEDRIIGWQLDIAQKCADKIPHSGFAVLSIVCSHFEMIAKFKDGYINDDRNEKSGYYFKLEARDFITRFPSIELTLRDKLANKLWQGVRCALYHTGITKGVNLSRDYSSSIEFPEPHNKVYINPHKLIPDLREHFYSYVKELKNPNNTKLRNNFEARFDYQLR